MPRSQQSGPFLFVRIDRSLWLVLPNVDHHHLSFDSACMHSASVSIVVVNQTATNHQQLEGAVTSQTGCDDASLRIQSKFPSLQTCITLQAVQEVITCAM